MHILSIDRNKSPLQISGKVAGGVLRGLSKLFRAPIHWAHRAVVFAIGRLSCLLLSRFDSGAYIRPQFLSAVSHSLGAHAEHFVRQMTGAAAAITVERSRKLRRQQRLCDIGVRANFF